VIRSDSRDASGDLVCRQWFTEFYRGVVADRRAGEAAPDHRAPADLAERAPDAVVGERIDDDQTFRYADASGDHFEIHLDEQVARSVGLDGIIVHGLCTLAFAGRAAVSAAPSGATLRRLAVRFSQPVRPGATLSTRIWRLGLDVLVFDAADAAGTVVLRDGRVEFAR
jgi:acyl dehydratase